MINLVKNELTKVFRKKGIYILLIIALAFVVLYNFIGRFAPNNMYSYYHDDYRYSEENKNYINNALRNIDPENSRDTYEYASLMTELEIIDLVNKYGISSWQTRIIEMDLYSIIYEMYEAKYVLADEEAYLTYKTDLEEKIDLLDADDWQSFAIKMNDEAKVYYEEMKTLYETNSNKNNIKNLEDELKRAALSYEIAKMRLEYNIRFGDDFLNRELQNYEMYKSELIYYDGNEDVTHEEKYSITTSQKNAAIAKYAIENGVDVNNMGDSRGMVLNIFSEYSWIILIIVVMISGSIVSDEFSKGTIKLLLVKPYNRSKILASKFIVSMLMLPISLIVILLMQTVIGGLFFGFSSFNIPAVIYSFSSGSIQTMSIFSYIFLEALAYMPQILLLMTLAFAFSTIFTNTAVSVVLPIMGTIASEIINALVIGYNVKIMRFFVTLNWDFTDYMFGGINRFQYVNLPLSIIVCIVYFLIMVITTFIVFKNKDIKND